MLKRLIVTILALTLSVSAFAQDASDSGARLRALEEAIAKMQSRSCGAAASDRVLGQEIEAMKTRQTDKAAPPTSNSSASAPPRRRSIASNPASRSAATADVSTKTTPRKRRRRARTANKDKFDMLRGVLTPATSTTTACSSTPRSNSNMAPPARRRSVVEFAYLDFLATKNIGVRTGLLLVPMGLVNEQHEPTTFSPRAARRRRTRSSDDVARDGRGRVRRARTGLVARVRGQQHPRRSVSPPAACAAGGRKRKRADRRHRVHGPSDYTPIEGTTVGGSFYSGNTGQGNVVNGETVEGNLTLFDLHGEAKFRGATVRALWAQANIDDVAQLNALQSLTGNKSIGEELGGWYVEAGYDVSSLLPRFGRCR
jgi:hypothetical protein